MRLRSSSGSGLEIYNARLRPKRDALARKMLLPLVAIATVTAVMLFVFMCSLSIRRRISAMSFHRRLAGSAGSEMDKESDWCGPKRNSPVPLGPFVISTERVDATSQGYSGEGRSDIAVHTHPTEGTALLRGADILGRAAAQTVTGGVAFGVKRKTREDAITESTNKRFMVEDALEKFPPEPQPPMDPDLDSLIETLLSKQENVLFDHFFLLDDKQKNEMGDVLQDDSAQLNRDAANIPATPTHASAHTVASRATSTNKSLKGRTVSEKRSSQAATSLSLSYYESPKHSAALSPESWLLQYDDRIWGGEGTIQNTDNLLSRASNRPSSESQGSSTMVAESISQTLRHLPHGGQVGCWITAHRLMSLTPAHCIHLLFNLWP